MKIELDEKSIDNIVKYVNEHPKEIRELLDTFASQAFGVLMKREVLEKGADLYKMIKKEIQSSSLVTIHKCPSCRAHPLHKVKGRLHCNECGWIEP